jgi:hypothetical protein
MKSLTSFHLLMMIGLILFFSLLLLLIQFGCSSQKYHIDPALHLDDYYPLKLFHAKPIDLPAIW